MSQCTVLRDGAFLWPLIPSMASLNFPCTGTYSMVLPILFTSLLSRIRLASQSDEVLDSLPFFFFFHIPSPSKILAHLILSWCLLLTGLETAAAIAAKSLQSCPTLCDPIDGSPPGFLSLGFSRQEHWSGLPFPPPMHESEKWKWSRSVVSNS